MLVNGKSVLVLQKMALSKLLIWISITAAGAHATIASLLQRLVNINSIPLYNKVTAVHYGTEGVY